MHALWSCAAQARSSCRCSSCLHAASAIARRTTTATSKRGIKFGNLFTACYSTIIATAVFADARVKEDRRKEWDRIIAEAKAGLPVDETAIPKSTYGQRKTEKLGFDLEYYPAPVHRGSWNNSSFKPPNPKSGYVPQGARLRRLDNQLETLASSPDKCATVPDEPSTSSPGQTEDWFDLDDIQALPSRNFSPREPYNREHLDKMGEMVRNLIDQLLLKIDIASVRKTTPASSDINLEGQKVGIAQRIEELRTSFIRLPAYSWGSDSTFLQEQRTALHKSLVTLCVNASPAPNTKPDRSSVELLVAKICYNLLISTNPPNIGTYNILIRELTRLKQHELSQIVVNSFLHDCRMRPNERSITLILDHYHSKNDPVGFQDAINRMRASGGHMLIESKTVYRLCSPAVRLWAVTNRIGQNGAWLCQKVDRTPAIFESLIRASFDLKGLKAAIRFIRAALREGQTVPTRVICRVVEACLTRMDYKAARRLLNAIVSAWQIGSTSIIELSPDFRYAFHQLLALCNISSAPGSTLIHAPFISHNTVQDMLRWLRIQSIEDSINRIHYLILSLGVTLESPLPRVSGTSEFPMPYTPLRKTGARKALEILKNASRSEHSRDTRRAERAAKASSIRLQVLRAEFNDLVISTAGISQELERFRVRQTRWETIKDIEAEIAVQADLVSIQEYELISHLSSGLPVWYWNKLAFKFHEIHAQGRMVRRPLKQFKRLSEQAGKRRQRILDAILSDKKEATSPNLLDAVQVERQHYTKQDTEGSLGDDVSVTENTSNVPELELSHDFGHKSAELYPYRFQLPSSAEPYPRFKLPSPPAILLRRPDNPAPLSPSCSFDTFTAE